YHRTSTDRHRLRQRLRAGRHLAGGARKRRKVAHLPALHRAPIWPISEPTDRRNPRSMRHVVLALMLLLGLTPAAAAAPLGAASGLMLGQAPPLARGAVPAVGAPDNDFGIEGAEPRLPDAPARRDRPAMSSNAAPADRGLSFDVEI